MRIQKYIEKDGAFIRNPRIPAPTPKHHPAFDAFTLEQHANAIHALGKRAVTDIIEIGRRLTVAKEIAGHGNFLAWLRREFGWEIRTAQTFMSVYEAVAKNAKFAHLDVPVSSLYLLAAPSTPPKVVEAVAERAEAGEKLTHGEVKAAIEAAKPPTSQTNRDGKRGLSHKR
jgi:hypothetical protein